MTKAYNKMKTPSGVAAGATATCDLDLGYTYHRLDIRMSDGVGDIAEAAWGSNIGEIRLMVDGDAKITIDAADLVSLNKYYGHTHDNGILPLFLDRQQMRTILGTEQTAYDTNGGMTSFNLEVDLKAGITIGQFNIYAVQSDGMFPAGHPQAGLPKSFGAHLRIQKFHHNQGIIGEAEITDIPRGAYNMFATHFKTNAITAVEVHQNQRRFLKFGDIALLNQHNKIGGRVPQPGFTHIDYIPDNILRETLPMAVKDHRVKATFNAAAAVPFYVESIQGNFQLV